MLIRSGMVANTHGATALSLEMPAGKAARIRELHIWLDAHQAEDWSITIDRKSIMQFVAPDEWYMIGENPDSVEESMNETFRRAGLWPVIPLGEGETLEITAPGTDNFMEVVYDLYDAADVSPSEPNGSKADTYRLFQTISNAAERATVGDLPLDQSDLGSQYPAFPGGELVPPKMQMTLLGMFGTPWSHAALGVLGQYTTYLKMLADREDVLDMSLLGMLYRSDDFKTTTGLNMYCCASRLNKGSSKGSARIVTFDPPIVFPSGSELNVYATVAGGCANVFAAGDVQLGMIFDVARIG